MKQTKHKHCTSIWHHAKKGVRAGNSPVWKPRPMDIAEAEFEARTEEQHEARLKQLFPKMSREDAKRLGKELTE